MLYLLRSDEAEKVQSDFGWDWDHTSLLKESIEMCIWWAWMVVLMSPIPTWASTMQDRGPIPLPINLLLGL
jgi:hypothetical protein